MLDFLIFSCEILYGVLLAWSCVRIEYAQIILIRSLLNWTEIALQVGLLQITIRFGLSFLVITLFSAGDLVSWYHLRVLSLNFLQLAGQYMIVGLIFAKIARNRRGHALLHILKDACQSEKANCSGLSKILHRSLEHLDLIIAEELGFNVRKTSHEASLEELLQILHDLIARLFSLSFSQVNLGDFFNLVNLVVKELQVIFYHAKYLYDA